MLLFLFLSFLFSATPPKPCVEREKAKRRQNTGPTSQGNVNIFRGSVLLTAASPCRFRPTTMAPGGLPRHPTLGAKDASGLTTILSEVTSILVVEVLTGLAGELTSVYAVPNKDVDIRKEPSGLASRSDASGLELQRSIDAFSNGEGNVVIGFVHSGTGSDGRRA
jgi:hypothetical protein